jgi:hypothetical protein
MRTWVKAHHAHPCGNCSREIPVGAVELEIGEAKLPRCVRCATEMFGEEPPELPELEPMPAQTGFSRSGFTSTRYLSASGRWRDVRKLQAGDK